VETNPLIPSSKTLHPSIPQRFYPLSANLDTNFEYIVTVILNLAMTHPLALGLSQSYINTFDDLRTIDIDDVHEFRYNLANDPIEDPGTKLHVTAVKKIQRMVCYARFKEGLNDKESDDPTTWDIDT
jgi:hypothetical protein